MSTEKWKTEHKEDQRKYQREWYARNREKHKKIIHDRKQEMAKWFRDYKATLKCSRCPENHPATFDFHHLDGEEKEMEVCLTVWGGWCKERILKEIAKCIVLCANCHRKLHSDENAGVSTLPSKQ